MLPTTFVLEPGGTYDSDSMGYGRWSYHASTLSLREMGVQSPPVWQSYQNGAGQFHGLSAPIVLRMVGGTLRLYAGTRPGESPRWIGFRRSNRSPKVSARATEKSSEGAIPYRPPRPTGPDPAKAPVTLRPLIGYWTPSASRTQEPRLLKGRPRQEKLLLWPDGTYDSDGLFGSGRWSYQAPRLVLTQTDATFPNLGQIYQHSGQRGYDRSVPVVMRRIGDELRMDHGSKRPKGPARWISFVKANGPLRFSSFQIDRMERANKAKGRNP